MNTISQVFDEAANGLERDGWFGSFPNSDTQPTATCIANAVFRVAKRGDLDLWLPARRALSAHIGVGELGDIWAWNDAPERTKSEVVGVLRAAAVIAASRESAATHAPTQVGASL